MVTPDDIVQYARTWIGTKWRHQGRSRDGIDCVGLLVKIAEHFDLPRTDVTGYRRQPDHAFVDYIRKYSDPVRPRVPVHGGIALFNDSVMPCHAGIFAVDSNGTVSVIHAESWPRRRVHAQGYEAGSMNLKDRLVDIRLFKGVNYVV